MMPSAIRPIQSFTPLMKRYIVSCAQPSMRGHQMKISFRHLGACPMPSSCIFQPLPDLPVRLSLGSAERFMQREHINVTHFRYFHPETEAVQVHLYVRHFRPRFDSEWIRLISIEEARHSHTRPRLPTLCFSLCTPKRLSIQAPTFIDRKFEKREL